MADVQTLTSTQSLEQRIAAARTRQAEAEAIARQTANQGQIDQFVKLIGILFGVDTITALGSRVEWRERPTLVIPFGGNEHELVALPKPTGHVGWRVGTVELFEQKYAPAPDAALDALLVAMSDASPA
jgi:hypothetical protein